MLDTHVVIWSFKDRPENLSQSALATVQAPDAQPVVSAVTIWEMAIKRRLGKLEVPGDALERLESQPVELLPVTPRHGDGVADLPDHHGDPFDRLLVAQAQVEGIPLVTGDRRLAAYDVEIIW